MQDMNSDELADNATGLGNLLFVVCEANGVQIVPIKARLLEVVVHFRKDLTKLEYHQGTDIALNKRIAGLAFWIRRLKPIQKATKKDNLIDIIDINEQAAVWLMHKLLMAYCDSEHMPDSVRSLPMTTRATALEAYAGRHWNLDNCFNYTSLVYNLRYRNISPHHMALLLDTIMAGFVLKHTHFPEM